MPTTGAIYGCFINHENVFIGRTRRVDKVFAINSPVYRVAGLPITNQLGGGGVTTVLYAIIAAPSVWIERTSVPVIDGSISVGGVGGGRSSTVQSRAKVVLVVKWNGDTTWPGKAT